MADDKERKVGLTWFRYVVHIYRYVAVVQVTYRQVPAPGWVALADRGTCHVNSLTKPIKVRITFYYYYSVPSWMKC